MQDSLKKRGLHLSICNGLGDKMVTPDLTFQQWVNSLSEQQRGLVYLWIANGPWWDAPKKHPDDYFTWDGDRDNVLVTTTGLAEAACLCAMGREAWLATVAPCRFAVNPIVIWWEASNDEGESIRCEIPNFWLANAFDAALAGVPQQADSWESVCAILDGLKGRKVVWNEEAEADMGIWLGTSQQTVNRILQLLTDIVSDPFTGIGKPEPLKYDYAGAWSRRIDGANRVIYVVGDALITVLRVRGHYE